MDYSLAKPRRATGDFFYTWVAVGTFLIVFAGFARTFYLKVFFGTRPLPYYLHLHGLIFTAWFVLFFGQARLVARHRVDLHRRLGVCGLVLAPLGACMAGGVSIHALRRGYLADPASFANVNLRPFALDLGSSLLFLSLVAAALYFRRRGGVHKRLMVLASCSLLLPAIGRIPLHFIMAGGLWGLVGLTEITPLVCILYDTVKHRHLHPGFAWGGLVLLSSFPAFLLIGRTHAWLNFSTWLVTR
ncbi:MAG: hypothetical protein ACM3SQ_08565 [Betaproteobacteria bacterium]